VGLARLATWMENGCFMMMANQILWHIKEMTTISISGIMIFLQEYLETGLLTKSIKDLYGYNTTNRKFNYVRIS